MQIAGEDLPRQHCFLARIGVPPSALSFLVATLWLAKADAPDSRNARMRNRACSYSKLTWKSRTRRLSSPLNLSSSGRGRLEAMLSVEDYRQLAERCALLARECATPGVAEELRTLALNYLTRAASPMVEKKQQRRPSLSAAPVATRMHLRSLF